MILTKKTTCSDGTRSLIRLENSVMGRNLLKIDLKYAGKVDLCVMTSHFESTAEYGPQRMVQLKRAVKEMLDQDEQKVVIFGGDLNMRDKEVINTQN
jgi:tyrosyl-DNA phosphodiesterase 2